MPHCAGDSDGRQQLTSCYIGARKGEPRLARVDKFLVLAKSSQARMVNAMHWFKHSVSPEMFRDIKG